jgi:hypothetical protein
VKEGATLPPLDQAACPISPELALVDRNLADLVRAAHGHETPPRQASGFLEPDAHEALRRICALSEVNPPLRPHHRLALTVAVPAVLWAEALVLVASLVPLGAL